MFGDEIWQREVRRPEGRQRALARHRRGRLAALGLGGGGFGGALALYILSVVMDVESGFVAGLVAIFCAVGAVGLARALYESALVKILLALPGDAPPGGEAERAAGRVGE
jgi:hypothetical protein